MIPLKILVEIFKDRLAHVGMEAFHLTALAAYLKIRMAVISDL